MDPHHLAHPSGALRPKPGKTISKKEAISLFRNVTVSPLCGIVPLTAQGSLLSIIGMDVHTTPRPTCFSSSCAPACEDKA